MRERSFNKQLFDRRVNELENKTIAYSKYVKLCKGYNKDAKSLSDVEELLNKQTGFKNAKLSAEAMGEEELYSRLVELEGVFSGLNTNLIEQDSKGFYQVKKEVIQDIKEECTEYYDSEEEKYLKELEAVCKKMNLLPQSYRKALRFDHEGTMVINEVYFSNIKPFSRV